MKGRKWTICFQHASSCSAAARKRKRSVISSSSWRGSSGSAPCNAAAASFSSALSLSAQKENLMAKGAGKTALASSMTVRSRVKMPASGRNLTGRKTFSSKPTSLPTCLSFVASSRFRVCSKSILLPRLRRLLRYAAPRPCVGSSVCASCGSCIACAACTAVSVAKASSSSSVRCDFECETRLAFFHSL